MRFGTKPKTTIVTGGAGFLGSHLTASLVESGRHVLILDNLTTGNVRNLERSVSSGRATFVYGDVAVPLGDLRALIDSADVGPIEAIYHLASPASPEAYNARPWETLAVNAIGTMSLIDFALERNARFIFSSTSEIYGDPLVHPQPESYFGNVDPIGPRSCYDEGKRFAEAAVATAVRSRGLTGRLVRFFNCYGPFMESGDGRLIPALIDAALAKKPFPIHGTGRQTRSLTYVTDAVELLRMVAEGEQTTLQPINVGNDDERSVEEIARAVAEIAGVPYAVEYLSAREGDPQRRKPDLTIARSLGWAPTTSIEDGIRETLAWFEAERTLSRA